MKKIFTILAITLFTFSYGQNQPAENTTDSGTTEKKSGDTRIYAPEKVEVRAEFKNGVAKMREFLKANYAVPKEMIANNQTGQVISTFVVESDGSLSNIKIVKDLGMNTGEEMVRVLKLMPKWDPAELNGKKVRVSHTLSYGPNGGN
ncbi:energy transducer TonB [Flavobacterium foetidum]|uniref:energy transducer TonB n=1 Tax=Flavobacterium foetidum TaxID=2026681 RepID=UPI001074AF8E|nr:energy transducer TonB [Flavobacterium foetidum]KAF2517866.1 hypothetical protein E0W73_01270 [Flavobacterium foetidum]